MNFKNARNIDELVHLAEIENISLNLPIPETLNKILTHFKEIGKTGLVVGGAVRDAILGFGSKDIDIEVYGLPLEKLLDILNKFGEAHLEGKSFGVIKLRDSNDNDYDFSIPRRDSKIENAPSNTKGRGFNVETDINMSPEEAARRRDFTMNSLAYDPITKELHDYFGGLNDLQNKVLRATDKKSFVEDPLRVLRGMQFSARLGLTVDPETAELCKSIKNVPLQPDRVAEEWMKFLTKCKEPSKGLQFLIDTEWIDNYPELKGIVGVPQELKWHPEGSVDVHTGLTMDAASRIADERGYTGGDKAILIASAMCHDLGKATTTDTTGLEITSHGHQKVGAELTKRFLKSIRMSRDITEAVVPLVAEHMAHIGFDPNSKKSTIFHLAERLNNATIEQLEAVIMSDMAGRPPKSQDLPEEAKRMIELAREKGVYSGKAKSLIQGRDIIALSPTIKPGPELGEILWEVKTKQLRGDISTYEEALEYAKSISKRYYSFINGNDVLHKLGGKGSSRVGEILNEAWEAQLNGEFSSREEALQWLDAVAVETPVIESTDII